MYYNGRHFHATIEYIIKKFEELNLDIIVIITVNNQSYKRIQRFSDTGK